MKAILRNAYTATRKAKVIRVKPTSKRSGYTYKVKTRTYRVRATPVPDVGAAGKGPKLIGKLKGGMLTKYGYHPVESRTARERALMRAVKNGHENPLTIFRRLSAIGTLTKRTLPTASRIYKRDMRWIREKFMKR